MKIGDKVYDSTNDKYGKVTAKMGTFLVDIEYVDGTKMLSSEIKHLSVVSNKEYKGALPPKPSKVKLGYNLPVGLINWPSYQVKAENGDYNAEEPWSALNSVNPRKAEHDLKHLMFMVVKHHGGMVYPLTFEQTNIIKIGDTTFEGAPEDNDAFIIVHTPSKHVMRFKTDKKNAPQKGFESRLKMAFEGQFPDTDGWHKGIDSHEGVFEVLTGYTDVKDVITKRFVDEIKQFVKPSPVL